MALPPLLPTVSTLTARREKSRPLNTCAGRGKEHQWHSLGIFLLSCNCGTAVAATKNQAGAAVQATAAGSSWRREPQFCRIPTAVFFKHSRDAASPYLQLCACYVDHQQVDSKDAKPGGNSRGRVWWERVRDWQPPWLQLAGPWQVCYCTEGAECAGPWSHCHCSELTCLRGIAVGSTGLLASPARTPRRPSVPAAARQA